MSHPSKARLFIADTERTTWHDQALWFVRAKRDLAAKSIPEWEELRELASQIKQHTVANLGTYLLEFERKAQALGAVVHWASDAEEHNRIVYSLLKARGISKIVKSKSMLTEECHLNPFLEGKGIEVIDTDLGERIVQLAKEPPSHIVLPAIHVRKEEVGELFETHLATEPGNSDPQYLTEAARGHLREKFLAAEAGITGVNFAVAESGGIVICTNEGNADLGTALPKLHIASVGIEKLIPRVQDLPVFLRLLARSATGQPLTTYTSHFHGPAQGKELHIVLVDNGRTGIRAQPEFVQALNCIRCGACMNTCPVYRRSGGHSYEATVPGPIGSILGPLQDAQSHSSLPYACSLCGSCSDVCPVKIDLHTQLLISRGRLVSLGLIARPKRLAMTLGSLVLRSPLLYRVSGNAARLALRALPRLVLYNRCNIWGRQRELPTTPKQSFRQLYKNANRSTKEVGK